LGHIAETHLSQAQKDGFSLCSTHPTNCDYWVASNPSPLTSLPHFSVSDLM
jgi:hypothetical protein